MSGPILPTESQRVSKLFRSVLVLSFAVLIGGCATGTASAPGGRAAADAERLERFRAAAGEPVPSFRLMRLTDFTPLGERHLVVWTRRNEAWLLSVDAPCNEMRWHPAVGISSSLGRVYSDFDRVFAGRDRCRIREIRPLDVALLKDDARQDRESLDVKPRDEGEGGAQDSGGT